MKVIDITSRALYPTSIRIITKATDKETGALHYPCIYDGDANEVPENLTERDVYAIRTGAPFDFAIELHI